MSSTYEEQCASEFRVWLDKQKHTKDPLNELLELLESILDKDNISMFAPTIVQFVGIKESNIDDEIKRDISYGSCPDDNENCFMIIPPKHNGNVKQYQYTLKSFKFRIHGASKFSIKFGEFEEDKCRIKDELLFKIPLLEAKNDICEVKDINIKLKNGLVYMLQPDAIKSAHTPIAEGMVAEYESKFSFVKGFRFAHQKASHQYYAKLFEAEFY